MDKIRTLGFYQPYGSLMLYGKIETRYVREGKKPPFPLGTYLFYTTKKRATDYQLLDWSGPTIMRNITKVLLHEKTSYHNGYAIGIGKLVSIKPLMPNEQKSFVEYKGSKIELIEGIEINKIQYGLHFENVKRIVPFEWLHGKQGVGFVPDSELHKIKIL